MAEALLIAVVSFVLGLFVARASIAHSPDSYIGIALAGAALIFLLVRTGRALRRAASDAAKRSARQFLWSCIFFVMISWMFGLELFGRIWYGSDFLHTFGAIFWGVIACVAAYPVHRDAKRFALSG